MESFSGADETNLRTLIAKHKGTEIKELPPEVTTTTTPDPLATGTVHEIASEEELTKLQNTGKLVVTDWFATWCGPCVSFKPIFQQLAEEYKDVLFCKIDVDKAQELAGKHQIRVMPTFKASCRSGHSFAFTTNCPFLNQHQLAQNIVCNAALHRLGSSRVHDRGERGSAAETDR